MITFKQFLQEQQNKSFVFCFGRYSPPTRGHIFHFNIVKEFAEQNKFDYVVYVSKTFDNKKNPIPIDEKISYIKKAIPDLHIQPATNMFGILGDIIEQGRYSNIIYIAGGDYFSNPAERAMLDRLTAEAEKAGIAMSVKSSGERTPGVSGTSLRQAVVNDDFKTFLQVSPIGIGNVNADDVKHMFELTKQGLMATKK